MLEPLQRLLAHEQRAFLRRGRLAWAHHLAQVRDFLGEGLQRADPARPVLILGAGSGLEIPWHLAPRSTVGWDADPSSRLRTLLRHGRWAPWDFGDITGAFGPLRAAAERSIRESWSGRQRSTAIARLRLAAILPTLPTNPMALGSWIQKGRPGSILAANFMGQLEPTAQRILEQAFAPETPWEKDPENPDPLREALERWTERVIGGLLQVLRQSSAELWLVHDRAVLEEAPDLNLGSFTTDWRHQLQSAQPVEAWDPLCGAEVDAAMDGCVLLRQARWLWPVGPGQLHLVEALAFDTKTH